MPGVRINPNPSKARNPKKYTGARLSSKTPSVQITRKYEGDEPEFSYLADFSQG